ncbi:Asp-tRNA(Asn)/Glu-tRNA(Gln) amidotransferase subunit GatB [Candidatus Falkowbacteria bacterium]|nr:MAG: Asp-tRNA(Asn)/Glu-tRNA(Gln) amidotransferase subunit GatB [Candidatus Falkowbacteria bacterium]
MNYDVIIGLEIHTALKTKSKMFCACDNTLSIKPNTTVCPICLGHPGTLPVANKQAIEWTILLGLALGASINKESKFDRKNYFYPDLPKGYQISQYDQPLCEGGSLDVNNHTIDITRIHLEEDTGKLSHPGNTDYSLVDYNRAGTPLVEMVTEPVIPDAATAKAFCQKFQQILRYLDISGADMEKGEMRCEANISLQKKGAWKYSKGHILPLDKNTLNSKVEVKNINSFKSLEKAIEFEINRQSTLLDNNETILQETRGWDDTKNQTVGQRVKETSADYRYFPEPDLPPLHFTDAEIKTIKASLTELPDQKAKRFQAEYNLSEYDALTLVIDKQLAAFFEAVVSELHAWIISSKDSWERQNTILAKNTANWLTNDFIKFIKQKKLEFNEISITAENFAEFILLIHKGKINSSAAQAILDIMIIKGDEPEAIMRNLGLEQIDDEEQIVGIIKQIMKENPSLVEEYKKGKLTLLQFFVGQVMAKTKGSANPETVKRLLQKTLV